jgi:excinuclease ABC subunit C
MDETGRMALSFPKEKRKLWIRTPGNHHVQPAHGLLPHSMMPDSSLRTYVRGHAEDRPGVYRMLGPGKEILYVGKSVRVKSRLLSYFRAESGEKAARLIRDTHAIAWEYVPNEFSALVRELRLIKRWSPRYNVEHKRRRSFAFIRITAEAAPRILSVAQAPADGGTHFGPFPRPRFLTLTLRDMAHVLGLRDCHGRVPIRFDDQLEIFQERGAPRCIRAEIGSCLGPCCAGCATVDYARRVEMARRFLEGASRKPLQILEARMREAAQALEFEYAAVVRDRLRRLEALQSEMVAFRGRVESLSFVYRVPGFKGDDRLYLIRNGLVREEMPFPRGRVGRQRAAAKIQEVFAEARPDPAALTPEGASEILLVARWFRLRDPELARVSEPEEWLRTFASASVSARTPPSTPAGPRAGTA